jgi:uncharacterized protein (TIGR00255 family)
MIVSMTGYGKSICQLNEKIITIEIRTLNSKNLDLNLKIPSQFREKENMIRNLLSTSLERGKTEILISIESSGSQASTSINKNLLVHYYNELKDVAGMVNADMSENIIPALLRLPDVLQTNEETVINDEWALIEKSIKESLKQVKEFRISEGRHLHEDVEGRISIILDLLDQIEPLEIIRIKNVKDKIYRALKELSENVKTDENRFEQELIFYLEKLDITEEKVRLKKHLDYFTETINDCETGGKKLGFISQEIGREINTIGSKANDAGIQRIVVQMKDELEKIKEQLMNVL